VYPVPPVFTIAADVDIYVDLCNIRRMARSLTPKSLVLDLLRVAPEASPAPVGALVRLGAMFGFGGSTMRATLSRLASAGLVESDARGWYRPGSTTDPFRAAIEDWRRGETRVRQWERDWLAISGGPWGRRADQRRTERALRYLGFRPALARLWLRPDNLSAGRPEVLARLAALGASHLHEPFTARDFSDPRIARWCAELWEVTVLEAEYTSALHNLERSLDRLPTLPLERALVDTFTHGGPAIRLLALDPLLPPELVDTGLRLALFERMTAYDRAGRARWHECFPLGTGRSGPGFRVDAAAAVLQ
jgi:DNA-binding transcriptional regulator PaaX